MTTEKEKMLWASLFMMLLITSPLTVVGDNVFCEKSFVAVLLNDYYGFAATGSDIYTWGVNQFGTLGYGYAGQIQSTPAKVTVPGVSFESGAISQFTVLAVASNGSVYGWGANTRGNLGPGIALGTVQLTPVKINALGTVLDVKAHQLQYTSYALKTGRTLWAMGDNSHGQLGKPTATLAMSAQPVKINNDNDWDWMAPADRDSHICAAKQNGSMYCWGENYYGQVGDGTNVDRASPLRIGSAGDTWYDFYPVQYATIALHSNGTLYGWGTTFWGLFGDGKDYSSYNTPTVIAGGMKFKDIAVSDTYMIAVGVNGKLYGWGDNRYTQVNNNPAVGIQNTPNQITTGTNWAKVYVSTSGQMNAVGSAFAIKENDALFAWGLNDNGQLGLGIANTTVAVPTKVMNDVASVNSVGYTSGLITTNGEIYLTGFNNFNLLGDGTTNPSNDFHSCTDRSQKCVNHVCGNRRLRF